jgi:2-polyprenyl-3-methyl-5-hydroxy-6-metoxy-1,4-benzoquinol methylase
VKDFWNERFAKNDYFYGVTPNKFLASVAGLLPEKSNILCLGEGEGRNAVYLASLGHQVSAVDLSSEGQRKAQMLAKANHVHLNYTVESLETFDLGVGKWDAIVSIFCHLPTALREQVHARVQVALKPHGLLVLQSYNPKQLEYNSGGPKDIQMLYTEDILRSDFPRMEWIKLENSLEEISEGAGHNGMSSLLSVVGRKVVE